MKLVRLCGPQHAEYCLSLFVLNILYIERCIVQALGAWQRAEQRSCAERSGGMERCQNPFVSSAFWHDPAARVNNNNNNNDGVPGPAGGVEKERFQQTRSTHSGAEKKETLHKKLW